MSIEKKFKLKFTDAKPFIGFRDYMKRTEIYHNKDEIQLTPRENLIDVINFSILASYNQILFMSPILIYVASRD